MMHVLSLAKKKRSSSHITFPVPLHKAMNPHQNTSGQSDYLMAHPDFVHQLISLVTSNL